MYNLRIPNGRDVVLTLLGLAVCCLGQSARADLTFSPQEVGGDVVISYGGPGQSLDFTGMTNIVQTGFALSAIQGSNGRIWSLNPTGTYDTYSLLGIATNNGFGSGGFMAGGVTSGGNFIFDSAGANPIMIVDQGAGPDPFPQGTLTFPGKSLADLGINALPQVTLANLPSGDRILFGGATVPEPSPLLLLGVVGLLFGAWQRFRGWSTRSLA